MTQHLDSKTMPDFFKHRYDSPALSVVASIIVFVFLIPYTSSLYNGLSSLFNISFNIPYWVIIVVMAALTCVYVIIGGYMATAINDFIQGIIMLVGIVLVIVAVLNVNGGLVSSMNALSQIEAEGAVPAAEGAKGIFASFFGPDPLALLFVIILTSLGTWGLPQMVGKFYAIKNEDSIKKGTIISTIFAVIVAGGCYFLGGFGRLFDSESLYNDGKIVYDRIVPSMLASLDGTVGGKIIIGIVIVLVLAASMSTLSSLVLTSSSTLTLDLIDRKGKMTEQKKLSTMRIFVLFFVIVSAAIAIIKDAHPTFTFIAQMMGVSWGALAGSFLAPFLYGLYWKGATKAGVWASFAWGVGVTIVQLLVTFGAIDAASLGSFFGYMFKSSINSGVLAMVGGLILVPLVSLVTPKLNKQRLDEIFSCYERTVTVTVKDSIEEK